MTHPCLQSCVDEMQKIASEEQRSILRPLLESAALGAGGYAVGSGLGLLADRFLLQGSQGKLRSMLAHGAGAVGAAGSMALTTALRRAHELQDAEHDRQRA